MVILIFVRLHKEERYCVSNLVITCECDCAGNIKTSDITRSKMYDDSIRLVYGQRSSGKGKETGKILCAVLNICQPLFSCVWYEYILYDSSSQRSCSRECGSLYVYLSYITDCCGGGWQSCGHILEWHYVSNLLDTGGFWYGNNEEALFYLSHSSNLPV